MNELLPELSQRSIRKGDHGGSVWADASYHNTHAGSNRRANLSQSNVSNQEAETLDRRINRVKRSRGTMPLPPIRRVSMVPRQWERHPYRWMRRRLRTAQSNTADRACGNPRPSWRRLALRRRILLALLVVVQTAVACWSLARTFPFPELDSLQLAITGLFAVLFSWISFSFWTNVAGFFRLWRGTRVIDGAIDAFEDRPLHGRTAILMPVCDEEATRCFAAVEVMFRSLGETGQRDKFDFYILSDTGTPQRQVEEEAHWAKTCSALNGLGKIFYRRRRVNIKRKSGNIADFLRRWSRPYDFMVVLDADSLMTGEALVRLAAKMEALPQVGIIQTIPVIVNRDSLFARMQQFASRVYGPLFSASLHFWQLGESYYWGHNAIIRIEPFLNHCALARLPGEAPLGGEILSHDFVEAALMGRAGHEVWLALELPGSYEESPPSLLDELKRDRRWCQGNLQHLRLILSDGIKTGHRAILAMGVMAYVSALFWAGFLVLNTIELATQSLVVPNYFSGQPSLFPTWPRWHPEWAIALASTTALLLFLPKVLSFMLIIKGRDAKRFGGVIALGLGIVTEIFLSTLLAPVRMWFHSKFVFLTLIGKKIKWDSQQRDGSGTGWSEAVRVHGPASLIACGWLASVYWFNATVFVWLLPVAIPLILAVPLSVFSSRVSLGRTMRKLRVFLTPEELRAPALLEELRILMNRSENDETPLNEFCTQPRRLRAPGSRAAGDIAASIAPSLAD